MFNVGCPGRDNGIMNSWFPDYFIWPLRRDRHWSRIKRRRQHFDVATALCRRAPAQKAVASGWKASTERGDYKNRNAEIITLTAEHKPITQRQKNAKTSANCCVPCRGSLYVTQHSLCVVRVLCAEQPTNIYESFPQTKVPTSGGDDHEIHYQQHRVVAPSICS